MRARPAGIRMADSELRWQDEILQVMYWMQGEHLGREVARSELQRFLNLERAQLDRALGALAAAGLIVTRAAGGAGQETFALSTRGVAEGRRRFEDEFAPYLGRESHLICDDPDCDCRKDGWDGICHGARAES